MTVIEVGHTANASLENAISKGVSRDSYRDSENSKTKDNSLSLLLYLRMEAMSWYLFVFPLDFQLMQERRFE